MKTSEHLQIGTRYSRNKLKELFNINSASINNGIFKPQNHKSIWLFVTETKSSDRIQYHDFLDGDVLSFDGQTLGRTDSLITNHQSAGNEIILFYRKKKDEFPDYSFKYEGLFNYSSHSGVQPTHFVLTREKPIEDLIDKDLDIFQSEEERFEGEKKERLSNYYERNPNLRADAVKIHGTICSVCGFNFKEIYGEIGEGYIEVHHLIPISSLSVRRKVDPKTEMAVLCSNCHRMIHRDPKNLLSPELLRKMMNR